MARTLHGGYAAVALSAIVAWAQDSTGVQLDSVVVDTVAADTVAAATTVGGDSLVHGDSLARSSPLSAVSVEPGATDAMQGTVDAGCASCSGVQTGEQMQGHNFLLGWHLRALPSRGFFLLTERTILTTVALKRGGTLGFGAGMNAPLGVWSGPDDIEERDAQLRDTLENENGVRWAAVFEYG